VEIEAFAIANLVSKMESEQLDAAPIYSDVKTFPYKEFCGRVDILSGGFPCQCFSNAGAKKGVDDPRHLYPYFSRGIEECKPRIVFLENVEGIISSKTHDGQSVLQYVLSDLERLGYQAEAGIFSASEVGFPHQRKRVFIMGYSKHNGLFECSEKARREKRESQQRRMQESSGRCDQLSDTENIGCRGRNSTSEDQQDRSVLQREQERREMVSQVEGCSGNISDTNGRGGNKDMWREDRESRFTNEESKTRSASEFSDTSSERLERHTKYETKTRDGQSEHKSSSKSISELGNTERTRQSSSNDRQRETQYGRTSPWDVQSVARPNEQQHEWEEPRVKSKLGRTTNGSSGRVDRLRLLGNGVVPQVAAKAFVVLINRLLTNSNK
jgi:DNA (cytosine-5)-methyltransferase 1